jgi:hypothetical protein
MIDGLTLRRAAKMRAHGWGWYNTAVELRVGYHQLRSAMDPEYKAKRQAGKKPSVSKAIDHSAPGLSAAKVEPPASRVPQSVLFERERAMLAPRSLTATLLGDPPAGRSALDKRR